MRTIYLVGVKIYRLLIWLLSPFNDKARKWLSGRRGLLAQIAREVDSSRGSIWFHFASLGEFEQGRPVLEALRAQRPDNTFVVTFYSPSGYEVRKTTPLADHVFYLPDDSPRNAHRFIQSINPQMAIFTKYEYWPFYFRSLASKKIPLYLISAIFRPDQVFFKWYGGFFRRTLECVTHFFTQNEESLKLLGHLDITQASLAGDTRFDRVVTLPDVWKFIPEIEPIVEGRAVLVAGSTWPADEQLLVRLQEQHPDWAFIIAPHEIHEDRITSIEKLFSRCVRFSSARRQTTDSEQQRPRIMIIDNIGMLSSLYGYGDIAYIGGGFGVGIHNTLEAAAYGIPVIFGPNYNKFQEAKDLIEKGAGYSVNDTGSLLDVFERLTGEQERETAGRAARHYVQARAGATAAILRHLANK
ncbi:3-deoxy-D-manno-octulosonic acid transferase [Parapedobacter deserti]|uniref:3-deoxy-D-manno-octulosonic acid transferase n=1 Tax=Parapedobacter deserti TaxID=1912957 RepID=A0ABV7JL26_9SPHI